MSLHKTHTKRHEGCCSIRSGPIALRPLAVLLGLVAGVSILTAPIYTAAYADDPTLDNPPPAGKVAYEDQSLRVNVWHDKAEGDIYRRGESVRVFFETNADAFAVLYRIDAEGRVTILWPRSRYDDGFVFGYHQYALPAAGTPPIRVSSEEGIEYIEAIVSAYAFDLRELEVDFYHESDDDHFDFYVAGDPFLAINEVNYAVTGVDNPEDYVVTNYSSYYVHEKVDHPRYLCHQCHTTNNYEPYGDACSLSVHYDFGWYNSWYVRFGYYPLYYYPAYYYVDPWCYRPWVHYWYTPWYYWPAYPAYTWSYSCYNWRYAPLSRGDAWVSYQEGNRRYRPLSRDYRTKGDERERYQRRESLMVRSREPSTAERDAIRNRTRLQDRTDTTARDSRTAMRNSPASQYSNTKSAVRQRVAMQDNRDSRQVRGAPGLRVRDPQNRAPSTRPVIRDNRVTNRDQRSLWRDRPPAGNQRRNPENRSTGVRQTPERRTEDSQQSTETNRRTIRSVEPRKSGSRIWSGGRSTPTRDRAAKPQQVKPTKRGSNSSRSSGRSSTVRPSTPQRSGGSKTPASRSSRSQPTRSGGSSGSKARGGSRR